MTRALVLPGGGSKGEFQRGALHHLIDTLGYEYDVFSGVSVGSLNGAMLAMDRWKELNEIWENITAKQIYTEPNMFTYIKLLFGKKSLYSNKPLLQLLEKYDVYADRIKKPFYFGSVNLETGQYVKFTGQDVHPMTILSSTAIPMTWEPVDLTQLLKSANKRDKLPTVEEMGDKIRALVDGGVRNINPIGDVLKHDPDEIHVVLCEGLEPTGSNPPKNIIEVIKRSVTIMLNEIIQNDMKELLEKNDLVLQANRYNERVQPAEPFIPRTTNGKVLKYYKPLIVMPTGNIGSALDFSKEMMQYRYDHGIERAKQAVIDAQ